MKKFEGILIATDLDGTLLRKDKSVSEENKKAIEYFKENGGYFTVITGRPMAVNRAICEEVNPNAPIGCLNGGGIYDLQKKEYLWKRPLEKEALELLEHVDKNIPDMSIQVCGFEDNYFCKMNDSMERHLQNAGFKDIRCHYSEVPEAWAKVLFAHTEEEKLFTLRDLLESHPMAQHFGFIRSEQEFYEILPKGISKGDLVLRIADILGIDRNHTVAIGDHDNDVSMISMAGLGVAVANASESAKNAADIITVSNEEHAIAQLIYDIEKGLIEI